MIRPERRTTPLVAALLGLGLLCGAPREVDARGKRKHKRKPRLYVVVDYPYQLWNQGGTKIHLVAYGPRLKPLPGAVAFLGTRRLGKTDKHGTLVFKFKASSTWRGGNIRVRKKIKGKVLESSIRFEAYRRTASFAKTRIYLYTDRKWYRPGDKVRARVIAWALKQKYKPLAGRVAVFKLTGSSSGDVESKTVPLDAFGTGHATFDLKDLDTGDYTIKAEVEEETAERELKLAYFKRPAVEIGHSFKGYVTARTGRIVGRIILTDVMGRSPKGGTLTVEASGSSSGNRVRRFKLDGRAGYVVAFKRGETRKLLKGLTDGDHVYLQLEVKLANGTTANLEHRLKLTDNPYKAVIELDRDKYRLGQKVAALVKLTDPDDNPVRRKRVQLRLDEHRSLWRTTNGYGVATFRFKAKGKPEEQLTVTAHVKDVRGRLAEASADLLEAGSMDSALGKAQVKQGGWVVITVTLRKGFLPRERAVHCDITDYSGAIVSAFDVPLRRRGARWVAKGKFRAPSWGSMLITMYTMGVRAKHARYYRRHRQPISAYVAGLLVEGQSLTVHPNQELKLTLTGVPKKARPGSRLKYGVKVRGPDGKLRDAMIGAALVDRNILALGDPLKKIPPSTIFYNAQLRVMATTGAKILTWPVVSRTWGCQSRDIALPPWEFQEGDGCGEVESFTEDALGALTGYCVGEASGMGGFGIGGSGAGGSGYGYSNRQTLTVRKRFHATSYWAPALRARRGRLASALRLPDTISRQELILVASDKQGHVGVLRKLVTVIQPLAVSLDLPPKMVASDELEFVALVRNYTRRAMQLQLAVEGKGLKVLKAPRRLRIPSGKELPVTLRIRALKPGRATLRVTARQGNQGDGVVRELVVLPSGKPRVRVRRGLVHEGRVARWDIPRDATDTELKATVKLDFPNVIPVLQSIQSILAHPSLGGDTAASVLRAVADVLRYKSQNNLTAEQDAKLVTFLIRGMKLLLRTQRSDGSFTYWRYGKSDPYHTAYVLETLLDMTTAGIAVPQRAMRRAAWYLLGSRAKDGLWDVSHLGFWEGNKKAVRTGLSAEIFRAAARASSLKCQYRPNTRLVAVAKKMKQLVDGGSRDPRTLAAALDGMVALYDRCLSARVGVYDRKATRVTQHRTVRIPMAATHRRWLVKGALRLLRLKKRRTWEPSWFSAYGGTLEATATALTLLAKLDRARFRGHLRDGLRYLLARRRAWGAWHNERGTAATLRALLALGVGTRREKASAVVHVLVNGKLLRKVEVDPGDPYGSAINLRHLRISGLLTRPKNRVEVRYSGRLKVPVRLVVRRWKKKPAPHATPRKGARIAGLKARLLTPRAATRGRPFFAVVEVSAPPKSRGATVSLELPTNLTLRQRDVRGLVGWRKARRARLDGRTLTFSVRASKQVQRFVLRLVPKLRGTSHFRAPAVAPLSLGPIRPTYRTQAITVR